MASLDYPKEVREFGKALTNFSNGFYDYDIFVDFIDYVICCLLIDCKLQLKILIIESKNSFWQQNVMQIFKIKQKINLKYTIEYAKF